MQLPQPFPKSLALFRVAKDEEELLVLLRTRPVSQLALFLSAVAPDESWCQNHLESIKLTLERLVDAFLSRELSLQVANQVVAEIQMHSFFVTFLPQDLLVVVGGAPYAISSLLLGVESSIVRSWLLDTSSKSSQQKRFSLGVMSLHTYKCLQQFLQSGKSQIVLVSSLEQIKNMVADAVEWNLDNFRRYCLEALSHKLTAQEISLFLPLAMRSSLLDLKQLCCAVWNKSGFSVELATENPHDLAYVVHSLPVSLWPLLKENALSINRLAFRENAASHLLAAELAALCKEVSCYDMTHTETFDDQLMPYLTCAEELRLARCPWLDDRHVEQLFTQTKRLKVLDLSNNPQITKQAWNHLKYQDTLRTLKLAYYHVEQENELILILLLLGAYATEIDLSWSSGVQDWIIQQLFEYNSSILSLNLSHCEHITDKTLRVCQEGLPNLQHLDISGNIQFSEESIQKLVLGLPFLSYLNVRGCRITAPIIALLKKKRPELSVVA